MIPAFVALLLLAQDKPILPTPSSPTLPNEVRNWSGFKYLPAGLRTVPAILVGPGDWSRIKGEPAANATLWRTKVVLMTRVDRVYETGPSFVWPGHHALTSPTVAHIRRALPQLRALVADLSGGAVDMKFDVVEEPEMISVQKDEWPATIRRYLEPRINGGRYDAEDGIFRGPYQSVFVIHPLGGESEADFKVQDTPVSLVGVPDVKNQEVDGFLADALAWRWIGQVKQRAEDAGLGVSDPSEVPQDAWSAVAKGFETTTEDRVRLLTVKTSLPTFRDWITRGKEGERGPDTAAKIIKDPERGDVLNIEEIGYFRSGGIALPMVAGSTLNVPVTPTFTFWAKSEAKDPIVLQFQNPDREERKVVRLGSDIPFAYDNTWHRVKIDLRPLGKVEAILIAPDDAARKLLRSTLGPIVASFSDFEATTEAPDSKPTPEAPSATALTPEARAAWAAAAEPGEARRLLMKDPSEAVRANAVAAAYARLDPADETVLIESALFTFEPTIFTPALRALGKLKTPTAGEALRRALRSAASDRARGIAAEILTEGGEPKFVPLLIGLNQARSRAARLSAVRALGRIPGSESALMRMAFLAQDDPEVKLETTLTADANDDYQGRKLLWSAINEPSDAVRLESLRRLSYSMIKEFQTEGLKGVRDDSVGVRVGLLRAWTETPRPEFVPAIRIALSDRAPRIRAAALDALGAVGEMKDIPFDDPDPQVQLAILRLGKKGLTIPVDALERFRKSPDPKVRAAVGA